MNKNHCYVVNHRAFFTAQIVDSYANVTHDMTIIFESLPDDDAAPKLVDYYFGEPDFYTTCQYVDKWLEKGN